MARRRATPLLLVFCLAAAPAAAQTRVSPPKLRASVLPAPAPELPRLAPLRPAASSLALPAPLAAPVPAAVAASPDAVPVAEAAVEGAPREEESASEAPGRRSRFASERLDRMLETLAAFAGDAPAAAVLAAPPPRLAQAPAPEPSSESRVRFPRRSALRDGWLYSKIYLSSLWWYTGPRLIERWREMRAKLSAAPDAPRAVHDIRGFFIAHRVLGSTGSYSPLGFRVASNRLVTQDALDIYGRYFPDDPAAEQAFLRFLGRAQSFNPHRRSTQFRKVVFHALRDAAVLRPELLAPYFDSLIDSRVAGALADYQREQQPRILAAFEATVRKTILELNAGKPEGRRVVGALLLGSFANGAAGPGSDLDVQALTEDGGTTDNAEFLLRLKASWNRAGFDAPVSGFQYTLPLSRRLIRRVHAEQYLIFSPYPEVASALARDAAGDAADAPSRIRTLRGWLLQTVYSWVLHAVLWVYDLQFVL